jgi:hypothetical protein
MSLEGKRPCNEGGNGLCMYMGNNGKDDSIYKVNNDILSNICMENNNRLDMMYILEHIFFLGIIE